MHLISTLSSRSTGRAAALVSVGALFTAGVFAFAAAPAAAVFPENPVTVSQLLPAQGSYTLKCDFHPGQVERLQIQNRILTTSGKPGVPPKLIDSSTLILRETVRQIKPDGDAVVVDEIEGEPARMTRVLNRSRSVLATQVEAGNPDAANDLNDAEELVAVVFPKHAVHVGDHWTAGPSALADDGVRMKANETLTGADEVDGSRALKISLTGHGAHPDAKAIPLRYTGSASVDAHTGALLKETGVVEAIGGKMAGASIRYEQTITRLQGASDNTSPELPAIQGTVSV
ncbi:MAG TPA: hypothetical protein VFJ58_14610 [Armatimonadota bacterium]|nr:hypothetical protein [Armatimonadota bacterium]